MLRLLDTIAHLIAPFTAAWDQEFGGRESERAATTPALAPACATEVAVRREPSPPVAAVEEHPPADPIVATTATAADRVATPGPVDRSGDGSPFTPTRESVYVCRGEGRGRRYAVAAPGDPGERFRRVATGGKARYVPLGRH